MILTILAKCVYFEASFKTYFCFSLSSLKLTKQLTGPRAPTVPVSASATWTFKGLSFNQFCFSHYFRSISVSFYLEKKASNLSIYLTKYVLYFESSLKTYFCFSLSTMGKKPGPRAPTIPASATRTSEGLSFIFGHYFRSISVSFYLEKKASNLSIYLTKYVLYFESSLKMYFCFSLSTTGKKPPGPRAPTIPASATRTSKSLSTIGKKPPGPRAPKISASATRTSERLSFIFGHYFRRISASSYFVKETLNLSIYATKRVNLAKCIILAHFCCLVGCNLLHE